jgi:hypothetical protein
LDKTIIGKSKDESSHSLLISKDATYILEFNSFKKSAISASSHLVNLKISQFKKVSSVIN